MLFCGWCRGRGVVPVNVSVPLIVDFLVLLRHDKGLSVLAVKGYRATLNSDFALKGLDLADRRPVSMLIRSFSKSVRPEELRPPAWDVTLVLRSLLGLRTCRYGLRMSVFLPRKLFLLALVSAKQVGELHALSHSISHSWDWGELSFTFVAGFVAKTQDPSSSAPWFEGFTVPALPNLSTNRNGRLLCRVRAVRCYLDRTAAHHPRCERLFVTTGHGTKEISKNTVSFWLWKTISRAPQLSWSSVLDPPPRARETRGIVPSLLFKKNFSAAQVLKAGTWCRHTTFTCHYLRDLASKSFETFHLGPVVVAQALF